MSTKVLAVDPSLNSLGYCVLPLKKNSYPSSYGVIRPSMAGPERLLYHYNGLKNVLETDRSIRYIVFEKQVQQMRFGERAGNILPLAELIGVLKLLYMHSYPQIQGFYGVFPAEIKEFATKKGNASKEEMIAVANGNFVRAVKGGVLGAIDDVIDAFHLARLFRDSKLGLCKLCKSMEVPITFTGGTKDEGSESELDASAT